MRGSKYFSLPTILAVVVILIVTGLEAEPPVWWRLRGVTGRAVEPSDYSLINQGQLKQMATQAYMELEASLPGGGGEKLAQLVAGWGEGIHATQGDDYGAVNIGQLKRVAQLFFDRLDEEGYADEPVIVGRTYPWSPEVPALADENDFGYANIGQAKQLFSFDLATDSDGDGMPDWWERRMGLDPNNPADGLADADGDLLTNAQEFAFGTNPMSADSDGDGTADGQVPGSELKAPEAPTNFVAVVVDQERFLRGEIEYNAIDYTRIELRWDFVGKVVDSFLVEKRVSTGEWSVFTSLDGKSRVCSDLGLLANQNNYYRVSAVNKKGSLLACSAAATVCYQVALLRGVSVRMSSCAVQKPGQREWDTGEPVALPKYYLKRLSSSMVQVETIIGVGTNAKTVHTNGSYSSESQLWPAAHQQSLLQNHAAMDDEVVLTTSSGSHYQLFKTRSKLAGDHAETIRRDVSYQKDGYLGSGGIGSVSYTGSFLLKSELISDSGLYFWNGADYHVADGHLIYSGASSYRSEDGSIALGGDYSVYTSNSVPDESGQWNGNWNLRRISGFDGSVMEFTGVLNGPAWSDSAVPSGFGIWNDPVRTPTSLTYHFETSAPLADGSVLRTGDASITLELEYTTKEFIADAINDLSDWPLVFTDNYYGWGVYEWGGYDAFSFGSEPNGWWIAGRDLGKSEEAFSIHKVQYQFQTNPSASSGFSWYEVFVPEDDPDTDEDESARIKIVNRFSVSVKDVPELVPDRILEIDPMAANGDGNFYLAFPPRFNAGTGGEYRLDPQEKSLLPLKLQKEILYPGSEPGLPGDDVVRNVYQTYGSLSSCAIAGARYQFSWQGDAISLVFRWSDPQTGEPVFRLLKSGDVLSDAELRLAQGQFALRVNPVKMQTLVAEVFVSVVDYYDGSFGTDSIRAMFVPELLVDANRDGVMGFDQALAQGADSTSSTQPYRFWVNDDMDLPVATTGFSDLDPETMPATTRDCADAKIQSTRDLEDFTRLWVDCTGLGAGLKQDGVSLRFEWKPTGGGSQWTPGERDPGIKLYRAAEPDGGRQYIENFDWADKQAHGEFANMVAEARKSNIAGGVLSAAAVAGLSTADATLHLIFEGASEGKGQLILAVYKDLNKLCESAPVYLDIKDIKRMYSRANTSPLPPAFPMPYDQGKVPSSPYTLAPNGALWVPRAAMRFGLGDGEELPSALAFERPADEENKCIIFVHGINMATREYHCYAESGFKRLWWAGYKGRFAAFRWGTPLSHGAAVDIYNDGEMRAWSYGPCLKRYVGYVKGQMAGVKVGVIGHSLGNAVVGSAFEQGLQVDSYVAMEAAVPLSCYFPPAVVGQADPLAGSFVKELVDAEAKKPTPDSFVNLGYRGYLRNLPKGVKGRLTAYQNQLDFWLATGTIFNGLVRVDWVNNQVNYKPNNLSGRNVAKAYEFHPERAAGMQCVLGIIGLNNDRPVQSPHEAMAYVARSRTRALGAELPNGNPAPPGWEKSVDLRATYGFGTARFDHSGQFLRDIQAMYMGGDRKPFEFPLYLKLLEDLEM